MKNRILVVDDEKEIADLVEIYLVSEKFDVEKKRIIRLLC